VLSSSSCGNVLFFQGRVRDRYLGLYNFRNRYYSPSLGRFLQVDPILQGGGLNLYSFVRNNPVLYSDFFGLKCEAEKAAVVAAQNANNAALQSYVDALTQANASLAAIGITVSGAGFTLCGAVRSRNPWAGAGALIAGGAALILGNFVFNRAQQKVEAAKNAYNASSKALNDAKKALQACEDNGQTCSINSAPVPASPPPPSCP
jgi:RHS repeat-associated protein